MKVTSYDPKKCRHIEAGEYNGTTFTRKVDRSKHYIMIYKGFGIQLDAFRNLEKLGCAKIIIKDCEHGHLQCSYNRAKEFGFSRDLGHGEQWILPEAHMERIDCRQMDFFKP